MTSTATRRRIEGSRIRVRTDVSSLADSLRATSNEALLTTFASLTHRIHAVRKPGVPDSDPTLADLLHQRDLIEAQILSRMGGE